MGVGVGGAGAGAGGGGGVPGGIGGPDLGVADQGALLTSLEGWHWSMVQDDQERLSCCC